MAKDNLHELTYEEALRRLEEIVNRLEDEAIPLEESLASFQEGSPSPLLPGEAGGN